MRILELKCSFDYSLSLKANLKMFFLNDDYRKIFKIVSYSTINYD